MKRWLLLSAMVVGGCEADPVAGVDQGASDGAVDRGLGDMARADGSAVDLGADAGADGAVVVDSRVDGPFGPDGAVDASLDGSLDGLLDGLLDGGLDPDGALDGALEPDAMLDPDATPDQSLAPDGGPVDPDHVEIACAEPAYQPGPCVAGEGRQQEDEGGAHIADDIPIVYDISPPTTGPHRARWGRWGEYRFLPPQRFLHNLEHGGIALLYHPCAPTEMVDALRALARARPADDTGLFRWVLTPYADLPTPIAVASWGWVYEAACVQPAEIGDFIDRFYRTAPEDVAGDGGFDREWLGR